MSLLGTWLAKFAGAMGGAPAAGAIVVGGSSSASSSARAPAAALGGSPAPSVALSEIYPCPNMGPPLLTVKSGQHVHVTGKTADGTWLRIHYGSAGRAEAWIPASAYQVLGSLDGIPVASCAPEALLAVVPSPTESMTATGTFEPTQIPTTAPTAEPTAETRRHG